METPKPPNREPAWPVPARILLCVAIFLAVKPGMDGLMHFAGPLDFSWACAHNILAHSDYVFGRDVVFTYGPLAYLLAPLPVGDNLHRYHLFRTVVYAQCVSALFLALKDETRPLRMAAPLGFLAVVFLLPRRETFDALIFLSAVLSLRQAVTCKRMVLANLAYLYALACLLTLAKFSYAFLLAPSLALAAFFSRRELTARPWLGLGVFAAITLLLGTLLGALFENAENLAGYLKYSMAIVDGYGDAMGWGENRPAALAILTVLAFLAVALSTWKKDRPHFFFACAAAPMLFILFKHGYTRADEHHTIIFHGSMLTVCAVFLPGLASGRTFALTSLLALALLPPLLAAHARLKEDCPRNETLSCLKASPRLLRSLPGNNTIAELAGLGGTDLFQAYEKYATWEAPPLGDSCGHVSFFPFDLTPAMRSRSAYFPLFVHQTYSAYTRELDALTAAKLLEKGSDHCLVMHTGGFYPDNRSPVTDSPALFATLATCYRSRQEGDSIVFTRKEGAPPPVFRKIQEQRCPVGQEVAIPEHGGRLFATVDIPKSPAGMVLGRVYRTGDVNIVYTAPDGKRTTRKIVPDVLRNPFIPNLVPRSASDYVLYLRDNVASPVASFRITVEHPFCHAREMTVAFFTTD